MPRRRHDRRFGARSRSTSQRSFVPLIPTRHSGRQVILTSGTTGRPKGARRSASASASSATWAVGGAVPRPRHGARVRSVVPRVGSRSPQHLARHVDDCRAAATVRPRGDARRDRPAPPRRLGRGAGDAATDPGAGCRDARPLRHQLAALHRVERVGARRATRAGGARAVRAGALQHLRLDRGRPGHARNPGGPERGAVDGRTGRPRLDRQDPRRARQRGAGRRDRAGLRRQRRGVRGLHRRWDEGVDRRVAVERRCRPLRRSRPPVHRRTRRRDDRVRWRERVPRRGRGAARGPPRRRRGHRGRRARRRLRPGARRVRRQASRRRAHREGRHRPRARPSGPLQGPQARHVRQPAASHRDRQGPQARPSGKTDSSGGRPRHRSAAHAASVRRCQHDRVAAKPRTNRAAGRARTERANDDETVEAG